MGEGPSFSGHESFPLRYGWLKKCVDAVAEDAVFFARDDAMVALGVGKNMVRAVKAQWRGGGARPRR